MFLPVRVEGGVPIISKSRCDKAVNFPNSEGMLPEKEFPLKLNDAKFTNLAKVEGMVPVHTYNSGYCINTINNAYAVCGNHA